MKNAAQVPKSLAGVSLTGRVYQLGKSARGIVVVRTPILLQSPSYYLSPSFEYAKTPPQTETGVSFQYQVMVCQEPFLCLSEIRKSDRDYALDVIELDILYEGKPCVMELYEELLNTNILEALS